MKPVIGVVGRIDKNANDTPMFYIFEDVRQCIINLGGEVLMLLPPQNINYLETKYKDYKDFTDCEEKEIIKWLKKCDGILLPGGIKITNYDRYVLEYAIDNDIPILGICLGMQIMSCYREDIDIKSIDENYLNHMQSSQTGVLHSVAIKQNSKLYNIIKKDKIMVNSFHKKRATPNEFYDIVAVSSDGVIEAIEYKENTFNLGVQWHPEKNYQEDKYSKEILATFVEKAKQKSLIRN